MPTVLRAEGFEVVIRTDDHEPPHVHVWKAGQQVKISLEAVRVLRRAGLEDRLVAKALRLVLTHREQLLEAWRSLHG